MASDRIELRSQLRSIPHADRIAALVGSLVADGYSVDIAHRLIVVALETVRNDCDENRQLISTVLHVAAEILDRDLPQQDAPMSRCR